MQDQAPLIIILGRPEEALAKIVHSTVQYNPLARIRKSISHL